MVLGAFAAFAGIVKARLSAANIDNFVFGLHYKWTTSFCFIACALVVSSDFIGSRIQCTPPGSFVATYCWLAASYTLNTTNGLGSYIPERHEQRFHYYYQWVPYVLFIQGSLFHLPHLLWKSREGSLIETLLQGLHLSPLDDAWALKTKYIVKYFKVMLGLHKRYFGEYLFCEILNFVNVLAQMFLLNLFFGGTFLHFGTKVFSLSTQDDESRVDPLIEAFPRVAKCDITKFGPSGTLENRDALCILPQNLLNEKIFIIMWVWFNVLICVTGLQLVSRFLIVTMPMLRVHQLELRGKLESTFELNSLVRRMDQGDFFLLNTLAKNLDSLYFKDILKQLIYDNHEKITTSPNAPIFDGFKPFNKRIDEDLMEMNEIADRFN